MVTLHVDVQRFDLNALSCLTTILTEIVCRIRSTCYIGQSDSLDVFEVCTAGSSRRIWQSQLYLTYLQLIYCT
jgi:hypothetical protein